MIISIAVRRNCVIIPSVITNTAIIAAMTTISHSMMSTLPLQILIQRPVAPQKELASDETAESRITRLYRWRTANKTTFEQRRIDGMRRSQKVRANLERIHRECKDQWRATALRNPKLRATNQHIAAKEWILQGPDGQVWEFRNLKKFIRDNPALFDETDVQWKDVPGKTNQAWCRAFHALSRLRPGCSKFLPEWNGWKWLGRRMQAAA